MSFELLLVLGLANWLATIILVESEITRPLRHWADLRHKKAARRHRHIREVVWFKAGYLLHCHLCAGTWIALAMAALVPPLLGLPGGFVGWALTGLAIKGVGHLVLEVVGRLQYRPPLSR